MKNIYRPSFQKTAILAAALSAISIGGLIAPKPAQAFSFGDGVMALTTRANANLNVEYSYLQTGEKLYVKSIYTPNYQAPAEAKNYQTVVIAPDGVTVGSCAVPDGAAMDRVGQFCEITITATAAGVYKTTTTNSVSTGANYVIEVRDALDQIITGRTWTNILRMEQTCVAAQVNNLVSSGCYVGPPHQIAPAAFASLRDIQLYAVNDVGNIYDIALYGYNGFSSQIRLDAAGNVETASTCTSSDLSTSA
jgi:hypothetical protein